MFTAEQVKETIERCREFKKKNPGMVFGADFPLVAKLLMESPEFLHICATCAIEHTFWCIELSAKRGGDKVEVRAEDMAESELFKWMSRAVYIGVQLEREGKENAAVDGVLKQLEKEMGGEGEGK